MGVGVKRGRATWYEPAALLPAQRALYDAITSGPRAQGPQAFPLTDEAGRLEGPFNALLESPEVGTAVQELGAALRYRTSLSARMREIAILELSLLLRCEFEWYAHVRVGRLAGLSDAEVAGLRDADDVASFDETERVVRATVQSLVRDRDLRDEEFAKAQTVLGSDVLADLVVLVGYYEMLARMLTVWRTPLPQGIEPVFTQANGPF